MPPEFARKLNTLYASLDPAECHEQAWGIALSCLPTQLPVEMPPEFLEYFRQTFGYDKATNGMNVMAHNAWRSYRDFFARYAGSIHLTPDTITQHSGGLETARAIAQSAAQRAWVLWNEDHHTPIQIENEIADLMYPQPTKRVLAIVAVEGDPVTYVDGYFLWRKCRYCTATSAASSLVPPSEYQDSLQAQLIVLKSAPTIVVPISDPRPAVTDA